MAAGCQLFSCKHLHADALPLDAQLSHEPRQEQSIAVIVFATHAGKLGHGKRAGKRGQVFHYQVANHGGCALAGALPPPAKPSQAKILKRYTLNSIESIKYAGSGLFCLDFMDLSLF